MKTNIHFLAYLAQFFLEFKYFGQTVQKIKKRLLFSMSLFFFENRAVYEVVWENVAAGHR